MNAQSVARVILSLLVLMLLQACVLNDLVAFGAHPDVLVLVAPAVGVLAGARRGAIIGFFAGLVADLTVTLPFGLSALCYVLVGFGVGFLSSSMARSESRLTALSAMVLASAGATLLYGALGDLLGQPDMLSRQIFSVMATVILGAIVLSYPVLRLFAWALSGNEREVTLSQMPSGGSAR